jgi:hypothetical protein
MSVSKASVSLRGPLAIKAVRVPQLTANFKGKVVTNTVLRKIVISF